MKLFNLDLHTSVIADIESICKTLYGNQVEITNWSISAHNAIFGKEDRIVKHINQETWHNINNEIIEQFRDTYDVYLKGFDGFIVTHTPVFALIFEPYGKPILVVNTCRYDQPYCINNDTQSISILNESLKRMSQKNQLTIVSNNVGDYLYLKRNSGINSSIIPSLCMYTNSPHRPIEEKFVVYGNRKLFPECDILVEKPAPGYTWTQLHSFKGIVHCPYEVSTMSIFEQFWAGVPLFFPTKHFYTECIINKSMDLISCYGKQYLTREDLDTWIENADYYVYPYINYYDSFEDCISMLTTFEDVNREKRLEWLNENKRFALNQWSTHFKTMYGLVPPCT
jgi:hypothetical protein